MRVRYVGPVEELTVAPANQEPFTVKRLEWAEVDASVAGKRPSKDDLGTGLLAQLGDDGQPLWELESTKKAAASRAANEEA